MYIQMTFAPDGLLSKFKVMVEELGYGLSVQSGEIASCLTTKM